MATKKAPTQKVNELAQALTLLNKTIAPQPEVQAQQQALEKARKQLKPSQTKVQVAHLLPFEGSALLALQLDGPAKPVLVKLFDRGLQVPLLASAGAQVPGSLGANGTHVFAQFAGLKLQPAKSYQFELVFEDNTHTGASTAAELVGSNNVRSVLALCTEGQAALAVLLKAEHKKDSELRKLVAKLIELEKRYVSPYVGKVDEIIGGVVEGWVWCPAKPGNRYEVQAWCGDRLVGYGMANLWREDLERLKKDDGRLKFEIPLSRHLFDGQTHTLHMKIVGQGEPDVSMNFGQPLEFNAPERKLNSNHFEYIMGYSLDYRLTKAMLKKINILNNGYKVLTLMNKVSLHIENCESYFARKVISEGEILCPQLKGIWQIKLAECCMIEKNYQSALRLYKNAIQINEEIIWAHIGLGGAYIKMGDKNEGLRIYEKARENFPAYRPLIKKIFEIKIQDIHERFEKKILSRSEIEKILKEGRGLIDSTEYGRRLSKNLRKLEIMLEGGMKNKVEMHFEDDDLDSLTQCRMMLEAAVDNIKN